MYILSTQLYIRAVFSLRLPLARAMSHDDHRLRSYRRRAPPSFFFLLFVHSSFRLFGKLNQKNSRNELISWTFFLFFSFSLSRPLCCPSTGQFCNKWKRNRGGAWNCAKEEKSNRARSVTKMQRRRTFIALDFDSLSFPLLLRNLHNEISSTATTACDARIKPRAFNTTRSSDRSCGWRLWSIRRANNF